jgi:hypothetical protein
MSYAVLGGLILILVVENVIEFIKLISQKPPDSPRWPPEMISDQKVMDGLKTALPLTHSMGSCEIIKQKSFLVLL